MRTKTALAAMLAFAGSMQATAQNLNLQADLDVSEQSLVKSFVLPSSLRDEDLSLSETKAQIKAAAAVVCKPGDPHPRLPSKAEWEKLTDERKAALADITGQPKFKDLQSFDEFLKAAPSLPINLCLSKQPTTVKLSGSFTRQEETNVLKSPSNIHDDHMTGLITQGLVVTGGLREFDVVAVSVGTSSSRYDTFTSKDGDAVSLQAFYQLFLGAYGYKNGVAFPVIDRRDIPPTGLTTFDTFAFGVHNQAAYTPTFRTLKADLLTPQIQLTRSNISLFGADNANECMTASPLHQKKAFCFFADVFVNLGQTFSDVKTLENTNIAAALNLGARIPNTNLVISLQTTVTDKEFNNVVGGRRDVLLQTGPALAYSYALPGDVNLSFKLPVTYYDNKSTVSAASWHGWVIMPTLQISFSPK